MPGFRDFGVGGGPRLSVPEFAGVPTPRPEDELRRATGFGGLGGGSFRLEPASHISAFRVISGSSERSMRSPELNLGVIICFSYPVCLGGSNGCGTCAELSVVLFLPATELPSLPMSVEFIDESKNPGCSGDVTSRIKIARMRFGYARAISV